MKDRAILTKTNWTLALCFAAALAFSGCKSTSDASSKSDQPQKEHPQKEHPEHPKADDTNK
jgi:hypothetical protein